MRYYLLSLLLFCWHFPSFAQTDSLASKGNGIRVEAGLQMAFYKGDLSDRYQGANGIFFFALSSNSTKRISLGIRANVGQVEGENYGENLAGDGYGTPNTFFSSTLFAVNAELRLLLFRKKKWQAGLSQGLGFVSYKTVDEKGKLVENEFFSRAEGEEYASNTLQLPNRLFFQYALKKQLKCSFFLSNWNLQTDYLDNIGWLGTNKSKDKLFSLGLSLSLAIGK